MVLLVPIAALILFWIFAYYLTRANLYALVIGIVIALALCVIWGIWKGQQYVGFDGLGYVLFAMLMAAPAILGTLLGCLTAWIVKRRKRAGLVQTNSPE